MKEDDGSEQLQKLQVELNQWKEKYKNMKSDNAELEDAMEQMTKEKKSSGSSHVDEMQRMRARINELEAAEEPGVVRR